jgi:hypothetical protein
MFQYAMQMGQDAAVEESLDDLESSYSLYRGAYMLLECLLQQPPSSNGPTAEETAGDSAGSGSGGGDDDHDAADETAATVSVLTRYARGFRERASAVAVAIEGGLPS